MPKNVPEARPISALRLSTEVTSVRAVNAVWATEISITPKTLMAMAATAPAVARSPRNNSPNNAACAGSVRE